MILNSISTRRFSLHSDCYLVTHAPSWRFWLQLGKYILDRKDPAQIGNLKRSPPPHTHITVINNILHFPQNAFNHKYGAVTSNTVHLHLSRLASLVAFQPFIRRELLYARKNTVILLLTDPAAAPPWKHSSQQLLRVISTWQETQKEKLRKSWLSDNSAPRELFNTHIIVLNFISCTIIASSNTS